MKKLIPLILCLLVGFFMSKFMLSQYEGREKITPVFGNSEKLYFVQYGVYSTKENMINNTTNLKYYIYNEIDDLFYVFIGITKNKTNSEKVEGYFKNLGYDIYITQYSCNNKDFLEMINYYDVLLEKTDDKDVIKEAMRQVLEKYEELVINERQD